MPTKTTASAPWQDLEKQAYHAYREWHLWLRCANENLPIVHRTTVALLGGRINARRALRLLLKDLNTRRLLREEQRDETRDRRNALTREKAD